MDPSTNPESESKLVNEISLRAAWLDTHLDEFLPEDESGELYPAARHLFDAGGKRLRPVTSLLVAEAVSGIGEGVDYRAVPDCDGNVVDIAQAAYALEILHTFSLIHDDIMDDDALRRGVPSVHEQFSEDTAILSGDFLYAKAFNLLLTSGATPDRLVEATTLVSETAMTLCTGQASDVAFETRETATPSEYIEMVRGKTAVLYGASAAIPAILLGAPSDVVSDLYEFGIDVGVAFQIHDDILDLTSDTDTLGKGWGSDLLERKKTLITLHALNKGVEAGLIFPESGDVEAVQNSVEALEQSGSIDYARETAHELVESGRAKLCSLNQSSARETLDELAEFLVTRTA